MSKCFDAVLTGVETCTEEELTAVLLDKSLDALVATGAIDTSLLSDAQQAPEQEQKQVQEQEQKQVQEQEQEQEQVQEQEQKQVQEQEQEQEQEQVPALPVAEQDLESLFPKEYRETLYNVTKNGWEEKFALLKIPLTDLYWSAQPVANVAAFYSQAAKNELWMVLVEAPFYANIAISSFGRLFKFKARYPEARAKNEFQISVREKIRVYSVKYIVAKYFIPNELSRDLQHELHHLDGNYKNVRAENLVWTYLGERSDFLKSVANEKRRLKYKRSQAAKEARESKRNKKSC
jgi:hypothetical protein